MRMICSAWLVVRGFIAKAHSQEWLCYWGRREGARAGMTVSLVSGAC